MRDARPSGCPHNGALRSESPARAALRPPARAGALACVPPRGARQRRFRPRWLLLLPLSRIRPSSAACATRTSGAAVLALGADLTRRARARGFVQRQQRRASLGVESGCRALVGAFGAIEEAPAFMTSCASAAGHGRAPLRGRSSRCSRCLVHAHRALNSPRPAKQVPSAEMQMKCTDLLNGSSMNDRSPCSADR